MEYHVFSTIFLHVILLMKFAATQDTCTPSSIPYSGNPPLPKLPDGFSMFVVTANVTSSAQVGKQLYVDAKRKLATVVQAGDYKNGGKRTIMDYQRNQAMILSGRKCTVMSLEDLPMDPLTIYGAETFSTGNEFFRLGGKHNPTYNGTTFVGETVVHVWEECIRASGKDNNYNIRVEYLFTNDSNNGMQFFGFGGYTTHFSMVFNINPSTPAPELLQVPSDMFCNMSKTADKMPTMPDEFEMNIEVLMSRNKSGFNIRDYVDIKEKYFRSDHHHRENGVWVPVHEIHDFNTGISYMINGRTFACEMTPLTNRSWDSTETDDHHHIRMRTTEEFFGLDHNDYIYEGYAKARGIPSDIFSRLRQSRRNPAVTLIQKWYFSRPDWKIGGMEGPLNDTRVPVMLSFTRNGSTNVMNFFNYDPVEPTNHILWPLRECYMNNRHYIYFRLNSKFDTYGVTDHRAITNAIRNALAEVGNLSKLRVSSVNIFKSSYDGVIAVRLYVLGLPRIKGTVQILHPKHETPLKDAVDGIKKSIMKGEFSITFLHKDKGEMVNVVADTKSYYDVYVDGPVPPEGNEKHDSHGAGLGRGAIAALVLSMVVIAILLTIVVLNFVLKRRGVQLFNYARHTDEATA